MAIEDSKVDGGVKGRNCGPPTPRRCNVFIGISIGAGGRAVILDNMDDVTRAPITGLRKKKLSAWESNPAFARDKRVY